jgi:uncharacterized protein YcgI (DUF1989 family)
MVTRHIISPGGGAGIKLARGEHLRLIDIEGGQTGDLMALSQDGRERLSNGRSFDYNGKILLSTGDVLWSDLSNPMLTIVADDVGRHDFLYASCSIEMYRMQYGVTGYHANCSDNLRAALREFGIEPDRVPTTAFNFFMNVEVQPDGRLKILPPKCRKGDSMVLRAEMDLAIAVTACPAGTCNDGPPRSLAFEVLEGRGSAA